MTDFHADLGALEGLVARLAAFERRAESVTSGIDVQMQRLHGEWTGWAAAEHLAAHRQWVEGAARMRAAADELRSLVATAHGNYLAAATANGRMWG